MTQDWRNRIDQRLAQQKEAERQRREEEARLEIGEEKRVYHQKLSKHQRRFRCHIRHCSNTSDGPAQFAQWDHRFLHLDWDQYPSEGDEELNNWDEPTGLERCVRCNKWTCTEHLHRGICSNHA